MKTSWRGRLLAEAGKCLLWGACLGLAAMVVAFGLMFTHWSGEDEPIRPVEAVLLWPLIPVLVLKWWVRAKTISAMVALQTLGYALAVAAVRLAYRLAFRPSRRDAAGDEEA